MPKCIHCGADVFWSFPRPEDECFDCDKPVAIPESLQEQHEYLESIERMSR